MPRYYLHLYLPGSLGFVEDEEGSELANLDRARAEAVAGVRSILSDDVKAGRIDLRGRIEVADAQGAVILLLPFCEAVDLLTESPA
jgi:hypothetical protein